MQCEILIPQLKPVRATQVFERFKHRPALLSAAPASLRVDRLGHGVEHTVRIRTDCETTVLEVVASIGHHKQPSLA